MSQSILRLTQFQVEKLRCMGGAGRASPYRITTYRGTTIGATGLIAQYGWTACNEERFSSRPAGLWHRFRQALNVRKAG
ncbi:hypothetical protein [Elongatibacter sediminis]|uniref:Uncharacterized protein n=1 Tax=Elongatibacter sediminis TaxID=3119006 RepID=A0AAW9RHR2_9GAMM